MGNAAVSRLIGPRADATPPGTAGLAAAGSPLQDVLGHRDVGNAAAGRAVARRSPKPGSGTPPPAAGNVVSVLRSPGEQLPADVARSMEPVVGGSLEGVRIHRDAAAGRSADALDASAYTVGGHVVFGPERYDPGSDPGRKLLAHELTHVAQQGASTRVPPPESLTVSRPGDRSERAADTAAHRAAGPKSTVPHASGPGATAPAIARQPKDTGTDVKPTPSPTGIQWEDAVATMNAILAVLPHVGELGIVLPTIDLSAENLRAMDSPGPGPIAENPGSPFPERILADVPPKYHDLVREWHYVVHPVHAEPGGITISIYGTMRETHLNMAVAQTQPLVNELVTEGATDATFSYLADYWNAVARVRGEIAEEVVAEAAEKAKTVVQGLSFEGATENEHAKTAVDKAVEAAHIAIKVTTQFEHHAIEHAAEHAADEAKRLKTLENLLADAGQEGAWPQAGSSLFKSAAKMDVVAGLAYIESGLHGIAGILAIADPEEREKMFRARSDLIGGLAASEQIVKVVLQLAAGATAVLGATTYAIAKLLGNEALAAEVLSKGIKVAEKFEVVISTAMVIHGVLTLLDSEASAEEKEEAALETAIGATPLIAKATGAFEGGPATLAVVISFFTIKWIGEAAYGFSVDLARISLSMAYEFMRREATTVNDDGLQLALALKFYALETDHDRKAMFWGVIPTLRSRLHASLSDAIQHATVGGGGADREPAYHEPLRKRFAPLAARPIDRDDDLLEVAQEYVHTVAEALAHPQEILEEDVEDMWEKHG